MGFSFQAYHEKNLAGALSTLEKLVALEPSNPQVYLKKAEILQRKNDIEGAVAAYFKATGNLEGGERGHKAHAIYRIILRLKPGDAKAQKMLSSPPVATPVHDELQGEYSASTPTGSPQMDAPPEYPSVQEDEHAAGESPSTVTTDEYADAGGVELAALDEGGMELEGEVSGDESEVSGYDPGLMPGGEIEGATSVTEEMPDPQGGPGGYADEQPQIDSSSFGDEGAEAEQGGSSTEAMEWGDLPAGVGTPEADMDLEQPPLESVQGAASQSDSGDALDWDDMSAGVGAGSGESSLDMLEGDDGASDSHSDESPTDEGSFSLMGRPEDDAGEDNIEAPVEPAGRIAQLDSDLWGDDDSDALDKQGDSDAPAEMEGDYIETTGGIEIQGFEGEPDAGSIELPSLSEGMSDEMGIAPSAGPQMEDEVELQEAYTDEQDSIAEGGHDIDPSLWEVPAEDKALPPIFSFLSVEDIESLPEKSTHKSYDDEGFVIREGDSSDSMFIIKSGSARVETSVRGKKVRLGTLMQGDFFGEVAFLTGKPRTASVIAEGELEVMEIDRALLQSTIDNNPLVLDSLLDMYKNRARDTVKRIREST